VTEMSRMSVEGGTRPDDLPIRSSRPELEESLLEFTVHGQRTRALRIRSSSCNEERVAQLYLQTE